MNIAFFSALPYEQEWFDQYRAHHQITYISEALTPATVHRATGHQAVCAFVNDDLSQPVLKELKKLGIDIVGMRCIGLDNVDQQAITALGMTLLQLPGYSPYAVTEQAVALLLGLIRHMPEAQERVKAGNFTVDGLVGSQLHGKTIGVIGTGRIGRAFANIMQGFGCKLLGYDIYPDRSLWETSVHYVPLGELLSQSDIISLHCPLTLLTEYLINEHMLALLKPSAILINTARGRLVETSAVLKALNTGRLAGYADDVYEGESIYFHRDYSNIPILDNVLNQLRNHPKVLLTAHQGFLTEEALQQIARGLINQFSYYENQQIAFITKASMC